jgi:glycerophosphoryl diester phosphodiesterase
VPVRLTIGLLLAVAGLVAGSLLSAPPAAADTSCVPPPVAHRGDSARAPENTYPAFAMALAAGVRRLELDVRFTNGDVPVLMHDETVDRTTNGTGAVSALTLDQIRAMDAGSWFGKRYRGTRVPTLFDILKLARSKNASVMVEL